MTAKAVSGMLWRFFFPIISFLSECKAEASGQTHVSFVQKPLKRRRLKPAIRLFGSYSAAFSYLGEVTLPSCPLGLLPGALYAKKWLPNIPFGSWLS